jgi:hypothetical protein
MNLKIKSLILSYFFVLANCGGDGGGEPTVTAAPTFTVTNYTQIKTNTTNATFSGSAVAGMSSVNVGTSNASVTRDASSNIVKLEFTNSTGTTTFSSAGGDTIQEVILSEGRIVTAYNASLSKQVIFLQDANMAIGTWYNRPDSSTGYASVAHGGTATTVDPATITSSATYNGLLAGMLAQNGYQAIYTVATVQATANFNSKSISLNSSGTRGVTISGTSIGAYATQDFTATLTDANADNTYEGPITDAEGKTGNISGTLYGANAETFSGIGTAANGSGSRIHTFAFGADR